MKSKNAWNRHISVEKLKVPIGMNDYEYRKEYIIHQELLYILLNKAWYPCEVKYKGYTVTPFTDWMDNHTVGYWWSEMTDDNKMTFWFEKKEDCAAFALTFA